VPDQPWAAGCSQSRAGLQPGPFLFRL